MIRVAFLVTALLFSPLPLLAQGQESDTSVRVEVLEVVRTGERAVPATGLSTAYEVLMVRVLEGVRTGEVLEVENDGPVFFEPGEVFFLRVISSPIGETLYAVGEPDRTNVLILLAILFATVTVVVGGIAGARALVSLVGSFGLIIFVLVPLLSHGAPPVITSVVLALLMLVFSMLVTHGWNRPTLVALAGSFAALVLAAIVAETAVTLAKLSGFTSDETVFLNFATDGALSLSGLLLGSILIGVVGVLNDISVSQAHTVEELHKANPALSRREIFIRSLKVGREHLGAVVNTLPLAYAGSALPLLMLFAASDASFLYIVNREIFAAELIRILSGGIALSLSGAVATVLAAWCIVRHK